MTLPVALSGSDIIGQAKTGTGKTLAFGIPLLQRVVVREDRDFEAQAKPGAPQALVVAPTRELASQVSKDLSVAAAQRGARVVTLYGGMGYEPQLDALAAGVEVVVGTPGRLLAGVLLRHAVAGGGGGRGALEDGGLGRRGGRGVVGSAGGRSGGRGGRLGAVAGQDGRLR